MGSRKIRGSILSFLSLVMVGLAFQNCSPVQFQVSENLQIGNSDNGYSYGGKPSGTFFRFTPGFTCENKESPVASVNMDNFQISLVENRKLQCGAVNIQLDLNVIDSSIYQRDVIGYQEGIFEGQSETPTKIPANLVELWCRDRNDEQGIETITHFDRETNQAVNRTFYSTLSSDGSYVANEVPDFSVSRLIQQRKITVKDGKNFELTVDRDKLATEPGLFMGTLKTLLAGKFENRIVKCRLGGSLDAKVWPVKQLVDFTYSDNSIRTAPDLSRFVFPTLTPKEKLFVSTLDGTDQKFVEQKWLDSKYHNIWDLKFSQDSKNLIFTGNAFFKQNLELFRIDLSNPSLIPISLKDVNASTEKSALLALNFQFSADNKYIIYSGSVQPNGNAVEKQGWIRSVPMAGGSSKILNPEISNGIVLSFHVSKANNKVFFQFGLGKAPYDLYSVDPDGGNLTLIPTHLPPGYDWAFDETSDGPDFIFVRASKNINDQLLDSKKFAIALDGSGPIELGEKGIQSGISPASTNLCPSLSRRVLVGTKEISKNNFVIMLYDEVDNILGVYRKKIGLDCHLVNSIPIEVLEVSGRPQLSLKGFQISSDQRKIILNLGIQKSIYYNRLFYVPLDSQPPMQVNAPILLETQISEAYILNDSKTVVFYGNQFSSDTNLSQVFQWKAP